MAAKKKRQSYTKEQREAVLADVTVISAYLGGGVE